MKHGIQSFPAGRNAIITRQHASFAMWMLLLSALVLLLVQRAQAQSALVYRVGAGGQYATLGEALGSLPPTLDNSYELHLISGSTFAENVLIPQVGNSANTLTIKPEAGAVNIVINGTVTLGNGARFVTLSGHNGTSSRHLTVRQVSTTQPAVLITGDARDNTLRDLRLLGNNASLAGGVVQIGAAVAVGNDDNSLTGNFIGNASTTQMPANLIYAFNASGMGLNDGVALINNELANYAQCGVSVGLGNGNGWNIRDNSFYYSLSSAPTTAQTAISFLPGAGSNDNTVSGNYIGGTAPLAGGGTWTNAGVQDFNGIVVSCGSATGALANVVENNVVRNINLSQPSTQSFKALLVAGGRSELTANNVTTVANNGTAGVNSLVSQAQTVLNTFTVATGQVMSIQNGETLVTGNLVIQGTLNHTGGDIVVNGDFTNTGAFAQTLGNLEVKGNMNNLGVFSCTTGGVLLTGLGPQTVSGGLYYNLEVRGSGVKTLTDDVNLANNLVMNGGILQTGASNKIRLGADAVLMETDASYVLGQVEARRTPRAGISETFSGLGLTLTPAVGSTLPGLTIVTRYTGPVASGSTPSIQRYFDITAPTNTGLNIDMRMDYFAHELNGLQPADLAFFKSTDNGATWQPRGVSSAGSGYAQLSAVDGFSRWTLGSVAQPLPVGLTAFRAQRQQHTAVLSWTTATERNNRGYGVEVSLDGRIYRQLAFVAAQPGTATSRREYRYVDTETGKQGLRYYRLRQEDEDGKLTYFGPRTVSFESETTLAAYPTEFEQGFTIDLTSATAAAASFTLTDALGRVVWTSAQPVAAGLTQLKAQPQCAPGLYILTATLGQQRLQQRVIRK